MNQRVCLRKTRPRSRYCGTPASYDVYVGTEKAGALAGRVSRICGTSQQFRGIDGSIANGVAVRGWGRERLNQAATAALQAYKAARSA